MHEGVSTENNTNTHAYLVVDACLSTNSLDNSEFMRNGDFLPHRLEAQRDAVNLIFGTKLRDNPENTVGVLSMAEK